MQVVFYYNFYYYQRGWPQFRECWHTDFFMDNLQGGAQFYGELEDIEGIYWNDNHKNALLYKHITDGVHVVILFLGPCCHLCNLQYSLLTESPKDKVLLMHTKRRILDQSWSREHSTIKNNLREVKKNDEVQEYQQVTFLPPIGT